MAPAWAVVSAVDAGLTGNQLYAVTALGSNNVYAVGQQANSVFPNEALIEHWDGSKWTVLTSPVDPSASALPLAVIASSSALTTAGQQETDTVPYTTYVASGTPGSPSILTTPNEGTTENDLFAVANSADGSTWAVGWYIDPTSGNHDPLVLQGVNGTWNRLGSHHLDSGRRLVGCRSDRNLEVKLLGCDRMAPIIRITIAKSESPGAKCTRASRCHGQ